VLEGRARGRAELAGRGHVDGAAPPDRDVAEGGGQVGLADAGQPEDEGGVRAVEEPQAGELVPELPVVADRSGLVSAGGNWRPLRSRPG
jgi:hypothetical protein